MTKQLLAAVAAAMVWTCATPAGATTGDALSEICTGDVAAQQGLCLGYISGVLDTIVAMQADGHYRDLCFPQGITNGEVRDITYNFLKARPRAGYEVASLLVADALTEAYPCPKR